MAAENILKMIKSLPEQIEAAVKLGSEAKIAGDVDKIIVAGMGGSGLPSNFLKAYMHNSRIPVFSLKDYEIPEFVNSKTLFFAISYSGNTEETLHACKAAIGKNAKVIGVASGGKLAELCQKEGKQLIKIPSGLQPRMALGYQFFSLLPALFNAELIRDYKEEVKNTVKALKGTDFEKKAQEIAEKFIGKVPVIYSSEKLSPAAYFWKIALNENAKTLAIQNVFPELNHNEMTGFIKLNAKHHVVILQDENENKRIMQRMKITKDIIAANKVDVMQIAIKGSYQLQRLFSAVYLGELVSYYVAVKTGIDPEPVNLVEELKKKLGPMRY